MKRVHNTTTNELREPERFWWYILIKMPINEEFHNM